MGLRCELWMVRSCVPKYNKAMAKKQAWTDVGFFGRYMKGRKAMQVETGLRLFVAAGEFLQRAPWKLLE